MTEGDSKGEWRHDVALRAAITRNLAASEAISADTAGLIPAAVCIIVACDAAGEAALILTLRARHLNAHSGQFALPGGRVEPGESALQAALREAREEVALDLGHDAVLGRLDDYPTRSGYCISPFVVWAQADAELRANSAEVEELYRVPLREFMRPGAPEFTRIPESDRPVIRYPLLGTRVHAPTAAVVYQFIEVGVHGRGTRVAHLEQPVWAWR